tara:strand:+ start:4289 stop:4807 length:519 start_codon:yes stop_codon:yes gene_type:complete
MARTSVPSDQLTFRSASTGIHVLDTYLEACEKGGFTLPILLDNLFTSSGGLNPSAVDFRVQLNSSGEPVFQARFGHYTDPDIGWFDTNQKFFRQKGVYAANIAFGLLDMTRLGQKVFVCTTPHTSGAVIDTSKFTEFFDGTAILSEIQSFKTTSEPRLDLLEEAVLLGIDVL